MSEKLTKKELLDTLHHVFYKMLDITHGLTPEQEQAYNQLKGIVTLCYDCWVSGNFDNMDTIPATVTPKKGSHSDEK